MSIFNRYRQHKYIKASDVQCVEDLKKIYFGLAQKLHPDHGGDAEEFKILNSEYQALYPKFKDIHRSIKDKAETEAKGQTWTEFYTAKTPCKEAPEDFIKIITALLTLEGVTVELCGRWIWISGNTKPHKEFLKSIGCRWNAKKVAWSWHYKEDSDTWYKGKKAASMEYIRAAYGSKKYYKEPDTLQLTGI